MDFLSEQSIYRPIGEVAKLLRLQPHVLRFWETKFKQVSPLKRSGGRRYYRREDVRLLFAIRDLLYVEGYTLRGAQKVLRERLSNAGANPNNKSNNKSNYCTEPPHSGGASALDYMTDHGASGGQSSMVSSERLASNFSQGLSKDLGVSDGALLNSSTRSRLEGVALRLERALASLGQVNTGTNPTTPSTQGSSLRSVED